MTDAELVILSLVAEGTRQGYEIQQLIDVRGLREWLTIGFSSVYYLLQKLEKQGLIASQTGDLRDTLQPAAHRRYAITGPGRGVLQTAVVDLLRQPRIPGTGFELGLANLDVLQPRQVFAVLGDHRDDLAYRLDHAEQAWTHHQADHDPAVHIEALYTHSIALMRAELDWLNEFLADWQRRYPGVSDSAENDATVATASQAVTPRHRSPTPDAIKMIQRLKRPPKDS